MGPKSHKLLKVFDGIRAWNLPSGSNSNKGNDIEETLKSEHFQVDKIIRHGFPNEPTCVAFDPIQHILAIGTKSGSVRLFGRPGVDYHIKHPTTSPIVQLIFLVNEGALISICQDDSVNLWNIRQKQPDIVHTLQFKRERLACGSLSFGSKWLYIGTERGNVYFINVQKFLLSGYVINWNKAIELYAKINDQSQATHPGPVVQLAENPQDSNKLLIGFSSGFFVLWDLRSKAAEARYKLAEPLHSFSWHYEGKQFVSSHSGGLLATWNYRQPQKPVSLIYPHALKKCGKHDLGAPGDGCGIARETSEDKPQSAFEPIKKIDWLSTKTGDAFTIFSGGSLVAHPQSPPAVTVMRGKRRSVLQLEHPIIDFVSLCESPYENEQTEPYAVAVLLQNDLIIIDLISPKLDCDLPSGKVIYRSESFELQDYPNFANPYPMDLNDSNVTCCQYLADCPADLIPALYTAGSRPSKSSEQYSTVQWPITGGETGSDYCSYHEVIITGHADGSIRFWDASAISLTPLYKVNTERYFESRQPAPASVTTSPTGLPGDESSSSPQTNSDSPEKEGPRASPPNTNSASATSAAKSSINSHVVPLADENPYAIHMIYMCSESRKLTAASSTHVTLITFNKRELVSEIPVLDVSVAYDVLDDFETGEEFSRHHPPQGVGLPHQSGSVSSYSSNASHSEKQSRYLSYQSATLTSGHCSPHIGSIGSGGPSVGGFSFTSSLASPALTTNSSASPSSLHHFTFDRNHSPPMQELRVYVAVRNSTKKWPPGYQPELICRLANSDGKPPPPITSMSLNSSYGLMAFGNDFGIAIVDFIQKTCLLSTGTPDLYGSMDPFSRVSKSPAVKRDEGKSPTVEQFKTPVKQSGHGKWHRLMNGFQNQKSHIDGSCTDRRISSTAPPTPIHRGGGGGNHTPAPPRPNTPPTPTPSANRISANRPKSVVDTRKKGPPRPPPPLSCPVTPDAIDQQWELIDRDELDGRRLHPTTLLATPKAELFASVAPPAKDGELTPSEDNLADVDRIFEEAVEALAMLDHEGSFIEEAGAAETVRTPVTPTSESDSCKNSPQEEHQEPPVNMQDSISKRNQKNLIDRMKLTFKSRKDLPQVKGDVSPTEGEPSLSVPPTPDDSQPSGKKTALDRLLKRSITSSSARQGNNNTGGMCQPLNQIQIEVIDLTGDAPVRSKLQLMSAKLMALSPLTDKTELNHVSRSCSSSTSSLENISCEAIRTLVFADTFAKKGDAIPTPCLWIGTSLGSVLVLNLHMPSSRNTQPVIVAPSGTIFRLRGEIQTISFLDCSGELMTSQAENWEESQRQRPPVTRESSGGGCEQTARGKDRSATVPSNSSSSQLEALNDKSHDTDRQFCILCSEKHVRVVSLPSQACTFKAKITETSCVVRADVIRMRGSPLLAVYLANGHILAFSLPSLRVMVDVDFLPLCERVGSTFTFGHNGHAIYFCSPSELEKITLSSEMCANLPDMRGDLFAPRDMPEPAKKNFFQNLFGGTVSPLDRDALFGESQSGKASIATASLVPNAKMDKLTGQSGSATSEIAKAKQAAIERGERLGQLDQQTVEMMDQAKLFAKNANLLANKYEKKDKRWGLPF